MTHDDNRHLDERDLIRAVVEEADLSEPLREHLSTCKRCRAGKERIETQLFRLGNAAEHLAPTPGGRVEIPVRETLKKPGLGTWLWRTLPAAGAVAVMVIALFWWSTPLTPIPERFRLVPESLQDEKLMAEVIILEENPLPQIYLFISGEDILDTNEEFMEFVFPDSQDDTSYQEATRGVYYV
jgi:hypothetical protein